VPSPSDETVQREFLDALVKARLLIPSGVAGVFGRSGVFEDVVDRVDGCVSRLCAGDGVEKIRFPPVVTRKNFERSEYLKSFPDLAGVIHSFRGTERDHAAVLAKQEAGEDWSAGLPHADLVMTPAACYPLYPMLTGTLPAGGRRFDVLSYCFRHEPSVDPARMQLFRMHENVRVGEPADVLEFRAQWQERGVALLRSLQLPCHVDAANDPFFGRAGRMLAANQRDQGLKFELLVPICSTEKPTACVSFNYHQDHFGHLFDIHLADGRVAHTACVGFGLERTTLALLKTHGLDPARWPAAVLQVLGL
jgi:seryl-tRNA synthetase